MGKIMVYFNNGCKAKFDRDQADFSVDGETFFSLGKTVECSDYKELAKDGRALVNWANVTFVAEAKEEGEEEQHED